MCCRYSILLALVLSLSLGDYLVAQEIVPPEVTDEDYILVETVDGREYRGVIVEERTDSLVVRLPSGARVTLAVAEISFLGGPEKTSVLSDYLPVVGFSGGLPALFNFVLGVESKWANLRVSGFFFEEFGGLEINLGYPLLRGHAGTLELFIAAGSSRFPEESEATPYLGAGAHLRFWYLFGTLGPRYDLSGENRFGAFGQLGLVVPFGD